MSGSVLSDVIAEAHESAELPEVACPTSSSFFIDTQHNSPAGERCCDEDHGKGNELGSQPGTGPQGDVAH